MFKAAENTQASSGLNPEENTQAPACFKGAENTKLSALKHEDVYLENTKTPAVEQLKEPLKEQLRGSALKKLTVSKRQIRTTIPAFFPSQTLVDEAVEYWNEKDRGDLANAADDIAAEFRNYWTSEDKTKADWPATWRLWCSRQIGFSKKQKDPSATGAASAWRGMQLILGDENE